MLAYMACGCAAQMINIEDGSPYCFTHDCNEVADEEPDLSGRTARCSICDCIETNASACKRSRAAGGIEACYGVVPEGKRRSEAPSSLDLPFFEHRPNEEYDRFFCGCMGWN